MTTWQGNEDREDGEGLDGLARADTTAWGLKDRRGETTWGGKRGMGNRRGGVGCERN